MSRFIDAEISFEELASWVERHELDWGSFELDSLAEKLSGAVLLARWDQQYCREHPESASEYLEADIRERIEEEYAEIFGAKVS